jgi:PAS domain S-box-containing protein
MKAVYPPNGRPVTIRGTRIGPDDSPEEYAEKLAQITRDEMAQVTGLLSTDGVVLECNGHAFGGRVLPWEDVVGKPLWESFWWTGAAQSGPPLREAIRRAAEGKSLRYAIELSGTERGNALLTIDLALRPVRDDEGVIVFVLFEGREITAQRGHRRESDASFETVLNQAPLGVYLVDADFCIGYVNAAARPVFGEIADLIGRDFGEVIQRLWPEPLAVEVIRQFRRTLLTGEPYAIAESTEQRLDRSATEHYEWRIDRIGMPDGRFGVVCYFRDISSQVKARQQVKRSEERFRAFVTASSEVVFSMSADWSEMRHLDGRNFVPDADGDGRPWMERYIHPEDRAKVLGATQEATRRVGVFELEHRVIRNDGSVGWTFTRAIPMRDEKGEIVEWFGAAHDVTARHRAEDTLSDLTEQSEKQRRLYQTILSSTPDLVYTFDLNHRFTYANEALLEMWGKTADEALGKNCLELGYEPWHAQMHDREIERVIATRQPIRGDVPFTGTHGRRIYDYIFVPVLGVNGEVEAIAGTTRDVTDRWLAEERVRDQEARLRFMAESMPQKIFTATPDGEVDYFNRQWMEFTGLAGDDTSDWNWMQLVHPDDAADAVRAWRHSIASGEPFQVIQRFRRADGAYRWHLSRAHAMRAAGGQVTMWIGSSTEIHEQKATEEELRRASRELEEFAYVASHDLQEPLRMVNVYTQLLLKEFPSVDPNVQEYAGYIRQGVKRMEELIFDLLSYSRAIHDEGSPDGGGTADLSQSLSLALANVATRLKETGGKVIAGPLPVVRGDTTQLAHVLQNLLSNSLKYRRVDVAPEVRIAAEPAGNEWIVSVRDNGIGFEQKYAERIFGLFKRLHHSTEYPGTGLGLAICQRIVERYRGRMWAEGSVGQGATFYFAMPRVEGE